MSEVVEQREPLSLLPLVKAYPNLSRQYGEVSCIAGLTKGSDGKPEWIRIYPVPFRELNQDRQFRKYQPIRVTAWKPRDDQRPESRKVDIDSIEVTGPQISTNDEWAARRTLVESAIVGSMCQLQREEKTHRTSLRIFRPVEVLDLKFEEVEADPAKGEMADAWARQSNLLDEGERKAQQKALEQIPFKFKYQYRCADPSCSTHTQSIVDWEIVQLYREVRSRENWQDLMKQKWLEEMCGDDKDIALIVGNQRLHRNAFLILGVWWPPKRQQLALADLGDIQL